MTGVGRFGAFAWCVLGLLTVLLAGCTTSGENAQMNTTPMSTTPAGAATTTVLTSSQRPSTTATTTVDPEPGVGLPGELRPNVVDDECLLTGAEFAALLGLTAVHAENTELVGGTARRSCFYSQDATADPAGRIDLYAPTTATPAELVARIATNSAGARMLPAVASAAVVLAGTGGSAELVVASTGLLAVLTVLPGSSATPADSAWTTAAQAIAGRLPPGPTPAGTTAGP